MSFTFVSYSTEQRLLLITSNISLSALEWKALEGLVCFYCVSTMPGTENVPGKYKLIKRTVLDCEFQIIFSVVLILMWLMKLSPGSMLLCPAVHSQYPAVTWIQ